MSRISLLVAAVALLAGCGHATHDAAARLAHSYGPEVRRDVARVRAVTAPFQNLDSAVAAGYVRDVTRCFEDPGQGAMGFHHINRAFVDNMVDVEHPEILLYERTEDGYVLTGVEYIIPYARWPREAAAAPTVMGQPLLRADDLKIWYRHAWVWKPNPEGLFADWNPKVHCHTP